MSISLRPFLPADAATLARLFRESVEILAEDDYTDDQRAAWAAASDDLAGFAQRLANALTLVAIHDREIAGFASFAGAFDIRRPLDPQVGEVIQAVIDKGYQDFIGRVAAARGKDAAEIDKIARGRVWSGAQAKERGLVDELGGLREAVAAAAESARIGKDYQLRYVERPLGTLDRFLLGFSDSALARVVARLDLPWSHASLLADVDLRRPLRLLQQVRAGKPAVFAYCFCELR